jgi:hypothetical protein
MENGKQIELTRLKLFLILDKVSHGKETVTKFKKEIPAFEIREIGGVKVVTRDCLRSQKLSCTNSYCFFSVFS